MSAGGPGFEAARPTEASGWIKQASVYFRIILLVSHALHGKLIAGSVSASSWAMVLQSLGSLRALGRSLLLRRAADWWPCCRLMGGSGCCLPTLRLLLALVPQDQRGTGRSTPITPDSLPRRGSPEEQAQYLKFFRADSIVRDAEMIRRATVPQNGSSGGRWSILGQSFGGFCCATYLSLAPEGLVEVLITGGIPPGIAQPCCADDGTRVAGAYGCRWVC